MWWKVGIEALGISPKITASFLLSLVLSLTLGIGVAWQVRSLYGQAVHERTVAQQKYEAVQHLQARAGYLLVQALIASMGKEEVQQMIWQAAQASEVTLLSLSEDKQGWHFTVQGNMAKFFMFLEKFHKLWLGGKVDIAEIKGQDGQLIMEGRVSSRRLPETLPKEIPMARQTTQK